VAQDGYCTQCGARLATERDHFVEQPSSWVAGVCDRGIRHPRNEDALALHALAEPGSHAVLVVCDGVSSSTDSDVAALAAARAARDVLAVSDPQALGTPDSRTAATVRALERAADAADDAVVANTTATTGNPASCTFVAAVVEGPLLVVGWVGDSRAYWLPDSGEPQLLSVDDSFAAEQIADGVPRADAENGPQAHAITRWLGVDAPDHTPRTTAAQLTGPGWVLLCSDGLWNYCSAPGDVAELTRTTAQSAGAEPLGLASALVDWAKAQGGRDNITVALARVPAEGEGSTPDGNVLS
jgi:serine/threonine protein phosphatase PrpC